MFNIDFRNRKVQEISMAIVVIIVVVAVITAVVKFNQPYDNPTTDNTISMQSESSSPFDWISDTYGEREDVIVEDNLITFNNEEGNTKFYLTVDYDSESYILYKKDYLDSKIVLKIIPFNTDTDLKTYINEQIEKYYKILSSDNDSPVKFNSEGVPEVVLNES